MRARARAVPQQGRRPQRGARAAHRSDVGRGRHRARRRIVAQSGRRARWTGGGAARYRHCRHRSRIRHDMVGLAQPALANRNVAGDCAGGAQAGEFARRAFPLGFFGARRSGDLALHRRPSVRRRARCLRRSRGIHACPDGRKPAQGSRGVEPMIKIYTLQAAAEKLMATAAIEIPRDYLDGLRKCADTEKGDLSAFVIQAMLENYEAAEEDRRPMCGDTGCPRWYVKIGNDARIEGGPIALEAALRRATAKATEDVPLRPNRVHPLWRTDHNNNCGIGAPEIEYSFHPDGDWIDLTTVHKGGLFGTDYRMLFPGDGIDGIKRFYLDTLIQFGRRGLACQPAIVGVGLGGSKDISMILGKQAACLRTVGSRNPDTKIAKLEDELKELGNNIGMG